MRLPPRDHRALTVTHDEHITEIKLPGGSEGSCLHQDDTFEAYYKVSALESVGVSTKCCGYESIYFLTNLLQAKAFFLNQFGKVITLISNVSTKQDFSRAIHI